MKNLLIGSHALDYWHNLGFVKPTTDWDVISRYNIKGTEWHDSWFLNNEDFDQFADDKHTVDFCGTTLHVMPLSILALIKRSHLWRDLSFDKHITHYVKHLQRYAKFNLDTAEGKLHKELLDNRTKQTIEAYPQFHPKLNQSVADFFDDAVPKIYEHDYLHELFAFEDYPMYTRLQTDATSAWCSKDLWLELSHQQKIQCVMEESYVIATERFLIPKQWNYPKKLAYMKALNKVCTTLCSGYFRDFAIDNYEELANSYDEGRISVVQSVLHKQI